MIGNQDSKAFCELFDFKYYVLRCTDGIFEGKFLYLNMSNEGEIFGSGDPDKYADITMYIEKAGLSTYHSQITYVDNNGKPYKSSQIDEYEGHHLLQDCGSETGTWLRVMSSGLDLHMAADLGTVFMIGPNQFTVERSSETIDEVAEFLRQANVTPEIVEVVNKCEVRSIQILRKMCTRDMFKGHATEEQIDSFFSQLDKIKSPDSTVAQSILLMTFSQGPLTGKTLKLDGQQFMLGSKASSKVANSLVLEGKKVASRHADIYYDFRNRCIRLRNLQLDQSKSCGVYRRMPKDDLFEMLPEDATRIGNLEFLMQRFNTGVANSIGERNTMEDTYSCIQDLRISPTVSVSYFAVFDGHGGDSCSRFLQENLHHALVEAFVSPRDKSRMTLIESKNCSETFEGAIREAFHACDTAYKEAFPKACKTCGSTAVVCLVIGQEMYCVNLGDARAVLSRQGKAVDLSVDYKASRKDE